MENTFLDEKFDGFPLSSIVKGFKAYGMGTLLRVEDLVLLKVPGFVFCSKFDNSLKSILNNLEEGTTIVFSRDSELELALMALKGFSRYTRSSFKVNSLKATEIKNSPINFRKINLAGDLKNITDHFQYQFYLLNEYRKTDLGFGFLAEEGSKIVGVVSAYTVSNSDCEIQIDVLREYRNQGIASYLTSLFVEDCLEKGLEPRWEAANYISRALGKKLGFDLSSDYNCLIKGMSPDEKLKAGLA